LTQAVSCPIRGSGRDLSAYLGDDDTFDRAILEFAKAYALQNERDYAALQAAAESGRITVQTGV
jgi:hypothetical protein